jgi:nucleoside-diphosphate kinase
VDRTLFIVKPDGVERGLVGEIVGRLERKQLRLVAAELRTIDSRPPSATTPNTRARTTTTSSSSSSRRPVLVTVVEGPEDTWQVVRGLMGATNAQGSGAGNDSR